MELRFDAILYYKLCNKNSDAGYMKRLRDPHLTRGSQVPYRCSKVRCVNIRPCQAIFCNSLATDNEPLSLEVCS